MGIRKTLEKSGCEVVGEAEDGDEAVTLSRRLKPDLITMDVVMKRMDGIKATRIIKEKFPNMKIIMLTQAARPSVVQDSMRAGAGNFIIKPVNEQNLLTVVKKSMSQCEGGFTR